MAISLPKFRLSESARMRESAAWAARRRSSVSSVEPSSTKMTSKEAAQRSSTGTSRFSNASIFRDSLQTGVITESSGCFVSTGLASDVVISGGLLHRTHGHAGVNEFPARLLHGIRYFSWTVAASLKRNGPYPDQAKYATPPVGSIAKICDYSN